MDEPVLESQPDVPVATTFFCFLFIIKITHVVDIQIYVSSINKIKDQKLAEMETFK